LQLRADGCASEWNVRHIVSIGDRNHVTAVTCALYVELLTTRARITGDVEFRAASAEQLNVLAANPLCAEVIL
jgi:hypothetical protein